MKWDNQLINHLQWSNAIINREGKEIVAQEIAAMAKEGDVIGAGSGSTVYLLCNQGLCDKPHYCNTRGTARLKE